MEVFYASLREQLSETVCAMQDVSDVALFAEIDATILQFCTTQLLSVNDQLYPRNSLFNLFHRLDILQEFLDQKDVTKIIVSGKDRIFVERRGKVERCGLRSSNEEQLGGMIQRIVSHVNCSVNVPTPTTDARLPDGSRVHIVSSPVSLGGPTVTIRKSPEPIMMGTLIDLGALTAEAAAFLRKVVAVGCNISISGGVNSSKTTFLSALSVFISKTERVTTTEDSAEPQLLHTEDLVRLETRNRNAEGEDQIRIVDLIHASPRMNPDRIVVGEMCGAEVLDMLQAMNTGHDDSLSTSYASSAADMPTWLETMAFGGISLPLVAIQQQIASVLDLIVHLGRFRDRSHRVLSITEIGGVSHGEIALHDLLVFQEEKERDGFRARGELRTVGTLRRCRKLDVAGLVL